MRIVSILPGRGKLGGIVATAGRAGTSLRARPAWTQPRTANQSSARALLGSLAAAWRQLSSSEQAGWNALAAGAASGYNLFIGCNRNLSAIGAPGITTAPSQAPTFPAIESLAVTPIYSTDLIPQQIYAWQLDTTPELSTDIGAIVRASAPLSPAKAN